MVTTRLSGSLILFLPLRLIRSVPAVSSDSWRAIPIPARFSNHLEALLNNLGQPAKIPLQINTLFPVLSLRRKYSQQNGIVA